MRLLLPGGILLLCLALAAWGNEAARAEGSDTLGLHYSLTSEGKPIGESVQWLIRRGDVYRSIQYSHINISSWWGNIDIGSVTTEHFLGAGFVRSVSSTLESRKAHRLVAERRGNRLEGTYVKVDATAKDRESFEALAQRARHAPAADLPDLIAQSEALLSEHAQQAKALAPTPARFDTTENHLPFFIHALGAQAMPAELRLLDTDSLTIHTVKVEDLGDATLTISGQAVRCRHLTLVGKKGKPAHLWITTPPDALPHMLRFVGEDDDGQVDIQLTRYL
ncbi:MAG TPA: hypothetical protein DD979_12010 [Gammaproteobacteria bacterium]|jgi:hypothetical protein|nr:hypothetical protein [Gammaproteobacteria bacterium]